MDLTRGPLGLTLQPLCLGTFSRLRLPPNYESAHYAHIRLGRC